MLFDLSDLLFPSYDLLLIGLVIYAAFSIFKLKSRVTRLENALQTYLSEKQPESAVNTAPATNTAHTVTPQTQASKYTPVTPASPATSTTSTPNTIPTSIPAASYRSTEPCLSTSATRPVGAPPMPAGIFNEKAVLTTATATGPSASTGTTKSPSDSSSSLKENFSSFESLVGQNIFGFAAAGLVFIGLILLGMLVVPYLGDIIRCALMYLLSAAFLAVGFVATKHQITADKSPFAAGKIDVTEHIPLLSSILLGTGAGGFFISILITRLYFGYLDDLGVLALLLVWTASCMYLVKYFDSIVLAVVAHVGMIISVCFSYSFGFSDTGIFIVIAYQLLACLIVVGGSLLSMRRIYSLGLLASLFLVLVASSYMWQHFDARNVFFPGLLSIIFPAYTAGFQSDLPNAVVASAFFIQFISASFMLHLLRNTLMQDQERSMHTAASTSYVIGEFLWFCALCMDVYKVLVHLFMSWSYADLQNSSKFLADPFMQEIANWEIDVSLCICILLLVLHAGIVLRAVKKKDFSTSLGKVSVIATTCVIAAFLLFGAPHFRWVPFVPAISGLLFVALALYALSCTQRDNVYAVTGHVILAIEALYLLGSGYAHLVLQYGVLGPLVALVATLTPLIWWSRHGYNVDFEAKRVPVLLASLFFFELSMSTIPHIEGLFIEHVPLFKLAQLMGLFVFFPGLPQTAFTGFSLLQLQDKSICSRGWIRAAQVNEVIILLNFVSYISGNQGLDAPERNVFASAIYLLGAALILAIIVARVWEHAQYAQQGIPTSAVLQVVWAIIFTLLCPAILNRLGILGELGYAASLVYMVCALICIVVGFRFNIRPMRLYGLVVSMLCVLKMVLFDFGDSSTLSRVVAFIIGGILCFTISLLYNYATKKLIPHQSE
ncbi:DUF2339 domain-containing protein [Atopobium fossor]|uniref:DUF2339 domain-containing protein n=1 Tax=Atopobium fossor TaxID=39487 RepID=UPI0004231147|nr:DUF2339 domain-containing protein [Atopobium fossor]